MTAEQRAKLRELAEAAREGGRTERGTTLFEARGAFLAAASPGHVIRLLDECDAHARESAVTLVEYHAKRLAGDDWEMGDADDRTSWCAEVHHVLNQLTADEDREVHDGRPHVVSKLHELMNRAAEAESRIATLSALLAECRDHLKYHREENGEMRFDDGTIIDRVAAALATTGKEGGG